jgi:hypothetical protein
MGYSVFALRATQNVQTCSSRIRSCLKSSWLPNRFCYFVIVGTSIESEHNDEILAEKERIAWAAA